jgi:hypothetical protein
MTALYSKDGHNFVKLEDGSCYYIVTSNNINTAMEISEEVFNKTKTTLKKVFEKIVRPRVADDITTFSNGVFDFLNFD